MIVLVTGLQGTGKSTVAEGVARRLAAPVFAWDWCMAALTSFEGVQEAFRRLDLATYRAVGWAMMLQATRLQLLLGLPVVLDALARDEDVAAIRALAHEVGAASLVVVLRCDDREVQRVRVEQRSRRIPGWHELTWADVERTRSRWAEPSDVDLILDSTQPIDVLVDAVTNRLATSG